MGMAVFHALDEQVTVAVLRELLELPGPERQGPPRGCCRVAPGTRARRAMRRGCQLGAPQAFRM